MLSTEGIKNKEVINIADGRSIGFVSDIEIDLENGCVIGLVLPGTKGFFSMFGKNEGEMVIKWKDICTIGDDVILVDYKGAYD